VLDRAMAKRPEDRYQSASDFAAALRSILPSAALQDLAQTLPAGTIPAHSSSSTDPMAFERTTPKLEGLPPDAHPSNHPKQLSSRPGPHTPTGKPNDTVVDVSRKTLLGISRGPGIALLVALGVLIGVIAAVGVTMLIVR
jgi:hypothetical protein